MGTILSLSHDGVWTRIELVEVVKITYSPTARFSSLFSGALSLSLGILVPFAVRTFQGGLSCCSEGDIEDLQAELRDFPISQQVSTSFQNISPLLQAQVFSYLSTEDLFACQRVCRLWNRLLKDPHFRKVVGAPAHLPLSMAQSLLIKMPGYEGIKFRCYVRIGTHFSFDFICSNKIELITLLGPLVLTKLGWSWAKSSNRELDALPPNDKKRLMEKFNNSRVYEYVGGELDRVRPRTEQEKFYDVEKFIDNEKEVNLFGVIILSSIFLPGFCSYGIYNMLHKIGPICARAVIRAKRDSMRDLAPPRQFSNDHVLRNFVDSTSGCVMQLPVQDRNGKLYDYLSLLDPLDGSLRDPVTHQLLNPQDFEFREDIFNNIQKRLSELEGQRRYFTSHIIQKENPFHTSLHQLREMERLEVNSETVHKLLSLLKNIDRSNNNEGDLIAEFEAKLSRFIKEIPADRKEQFYALIEEMVAAKVGHLELPWWAGDEDLEKIRHIPLKSLKIGVDANEESLAYLHLTPSQLYDHIKTPVTSNGLAFLANILLQRLVLRGVSVSQNGLREVAKIQTLQELNLAWTETTNEGVKLLSTLPLVQLDLTGTEVSDDCIPWLDHMASLSEIKLKMTKCSRDRFESWRSSKPSLTISW